MSSSFDSYRLYFTGKIIRNVVRARITMKEPVDLEVLEIAVNEASNRYPYFKKRVTVNDDGEYVLVDNNLPVVVKPSAKEAPPIGSKEVNEHLIYAEADGNDIYLYISHTLAGGKGIQPWVMTCIYQYVTKKYKVAIDAPEIRKPGSEFLPTELSVPDYDMLPDEEPIYNPKRAKPALLLKDYLNGFINPFAKKEQYYLFTFKQNDFMKYCRNNDSSVASFISILLFKAMDKVLPKKHNIIRCGMAHNPVDILGIPDAYRDMLSHIHIDYKREMADYDMEKLGTITRGQMILQSDLTCAAVEIRKRLMAVDGIDQQKGLKQKRKFAKKSNSRLGKGSVADTFNVNYTGYSDWGELADYIESLVYIVDGHFVSEVTAVGDKIFLTPMTLVKADKYIAAMEEVLRELEVPYKLEGPFPKNLPWHDIPR